MRFQTSSPRKGQFGFLKTFSKTFSAKNGCTKGASSNIDNHDIINESFNQISKKFTLDEKQNIAFKIVES